MWRRWLYHCWYKNSFRCKGWRHSNTDKNPVDKPLDGFKDVKPVVYSSIYPVDTSDYEELRESMDKLKLNDASLVFEKTLRWHLGMAFAAVFGTLTLGNCTRALRERF